MVDPNEQMAEEQARQLALLKAETDAAIEAARKAAEQTVMQNPWNQEN